jgi:hypothetical protein
MLTYTPTHAGSHILVAHLGAAEVGRINVTAPGWSCSLGVICVLWKPAKTEQRAKAELEVAVIKWLELAGLRQGVLL